MVDVARYFLSFTQDESCGKCTPCREGTKAMLDILTRITEGKGTAGGPRPARRPGPGHQGFGPLRAGQDRAQSGPDDPPVFPGRIRSPHPGQKMPGPRLPPAQRLHHRRRASASTKARAATSAAATAPRRPSGPEERSPRHRPGPMHQMRRLLRRLRLRRRQGGLRRNAMINLTIDGKKIEVEEGTTILQAARPKPAFKIPTLCYHPVIEPYAACRVCVVEVRFARENRPGHVLQHQGPGGHGGPDGVEAGPAGEPPERRDAPGPGAGRGTAPADRRGAGDRKDAVSGQGPGRKVHPLRPVRPGLRADRRRLAPSASSSGAPNAAYPPPSARNRRPASAARPAPISVRRGPSPSRTNHGRAGHP